MDGRGESRARIWLELLIGTAAGLCAGLTLADPSWLEHVSGFDPDAGEGWLELAASAVLIAAAFWASLRARALWTGRRLEVLARKTRERTGSSQG